MDDRTGLDEQTGALVRMIESDPAAFARASTLAELGLPELPTRDLDAVADLLVPAESPIPLRVYVPRALVPPRPALIWLHPGGFRSGSIDDVDAVCRVLADDGRCVVVSVGYRLAPEHPYPAALVDIETVIRWVDKHAAIFGIDPRRIAAGGQSAGATLAASYSLRAPNSVIPALQVLCYPILDPHLSGQSYSENAQGYVFTTAEVDEDWRAYLGENLGSIPPGAAPILAGDLGGMPPTLILAAGFDPARDDSRRYAERLTSAHVNVTLLEYPATIHAFLSFGGFLDVAGEALEAITGELRQRLQAVAPRLQHATIPFPPGSDLSVRRFYGELLGLYEKDVPEALAGNGFIWFHAGPYDGELHLIPEEPIDHRSLRHVCLAVDSIEPIERRLEQAGNELERHALIPGRPQVFVRDPFGNLLELTTITSRAGS